MKTSRKISINAASEDVWKIFATDFENAHKWMAGVPNSFGKELGKRYEGANSAGHGCSTISASLGFKCLVNLSTRLTKDLFVIIAFCTALMVNEHIRVIRA